MVELQSDSSYNPMTGISNEEDMDWGLAKAFIRDDGDGKPYVYIANSEGRLEKLYVSTGKIIQNSFIEIKNKAITRDSYLAFPYGDVKVRIKDKNRRPAGKYLSNHIQLLTGGSHVRKYKTFISGSLIP